MIQQKFEKDTPVFFYTMMNKIPGVVLRAAQNNDGEWIYEITWGSDMVAKNVPERHLRQRNIVD